MNLTLQKKWQWVARQLSGLKQRRQTINRLFIYSGSLGLSQAMMMVYAILLARVMDPGPYGLFAGTFSLVGLSSFLISWGMDTWMLRTGVEPHRAPQLAGAVLRTKIALGILWGGALLALIPLVRPELFSRLLILMCILDVWSDSALNTHVNALNLEGRISVASRLIVLSRAGRLASALIVLAWSGPSSPLIFALARALATLLSLMLALAILRPGSGNVEFSEGVPLLRRSFAFGVSELLALVYVQADVSILLLLAGQVAAGLYVPASGFINALFVIPMAGHLLLIPPLARLNERNPAEFRTVAKQVIAGFVGLGILLALAIAAAGPWIVRLILGANYQTTGVLLSLLSPVLGLKSIGFGLAAVLVVVNWQQRRLGPQLAAALANVLFNVWAIPRFGVTGVAVVYVISEVILTAGYGWLVYRWFHEQAQAGER